MTTTATQTIGDKIASEFSADKRHLTDAEQRRLAGMIDKEFAHRLVGVGWSSEYVAMLQKHLDICRTYIADRGIKEDALDTFATDCHAMSKASDAAMLPVGGQDMAPDEY